MNENYINESINNEEFLILKDNYLENVKSTKRVIPESIEKFMSN